MLYNGIHIIKKKKVTKILPSKETTGDSPFILYLFYGVLSGNSKV